MTPDQLKHYEIDVLRAELKSQQAENDEIKQALKTAAEAHHTALEVERQKKNYFNQDNQRLKAELERACDKLELERAKVRELEDRLAKYEKQWNDMNFTICKLEQDLRAKDELLERYQNVIAQAGAHWEEWLTLLSQPPPMPDAFNLVGRAIEAMREVRRLCEELSQPQTKGT